MIGVHEYSSWFNCRIVAAMVLPLIVIQATYADDRRFDGIGIHTRKISTSSGEAQRLFDQGVAFLYSFNHDEALKSFREATQHDPNCSAIYWAIALANGPHINFPMVDKAHGDAAWEAIARAKACVASASNVEQELLEALEHRYVQVQPEDRRPLDVAYAHAMRKVWQRYPSDADVGAIFAESLMDLWPWDLWTPDGLPKDDTSEILKTLETVMALQPDHALALHLYIHALEASPYPERAGLAAERLRKLQPGLGHLVHMPSHIDVRLGNWQRAIEANENAIRADAAYRAKSPDQDFFRLYMAHNHHMLAFAAMMQGQNQRSSQAISQMLSEIPAPWLASHAPMVDGMFAMPYELHIRFGRWDAILEEKMPPEILPITRAFRRYARGVAFAATRQLRQAREEQRAFLEEKQAIPKEAMFVMNPAEDVLSVAEAMLEGEILYREGEVENGIAALRNAVRREDLLRYIEPPDWIQPVRHALGATLLDAEKLTDAEEVYREDLIRHPNNGWSLHGLARSLQKQGRTEEAESVQRQFEIAWQHADVKLSSSCFCLPSKD